MKKFLFLWLIIWFACGACVKLDHTRALLEKHGEEPALESK